MRFNDPGFNVKEWATGLTFDVQDENKREAWGHFSHGRILKGKPVKVKREIKVAVGVLSSPEDSRGRTVESHRAMVDFYAERYDAARDPISGEPIADMESLEWYSEYEGELTFRESPKKVDELKATAVKRIEQPWREGRKTAYTDIEGLKLLANAFKAIHETDPGDDD